MNPAVRLIVAFLIRVALIFFAGWFALAEAALPADVSIVSRLGLALLFLIAAILVGEVSAMRMHLGMLLGAIRKARGDVDGGGGGAAAASADPAETKRRAVDELIKALGVTQDPTIRDTVHRNLTRITGQDLPADPAAWQAWWARNRAGFGDA